MIVGIDPGTTVGFAVLDLDGNLMKIGSFKNKPLSKVVEVISNYHPVLVSCDVASIPESVKKIASAFNATLFHPKENLSVDEKVKLTREYAPRNVHERDALAAALKAYMHYSSKLRKAKRIAREKQNEIILAAFREVRLADVVGSSKSLEQKREETDLLKLRKELGLEKRRVANLERENEVLRKKLSAARRKISMLEKRLIKLEKQKKIEETVKRKEQVKEALQGYLEPEEVERLFEEYRKSK